MHSTQNTLNINPAKGVLLDSSAWIDYLGGSDRGKNIDKLIGKKQVYIASLSVSEVCAVHEKRTGKGEQLFRELMSKALVVPLDSEIAFAAARIHTAARGKKPKFSYGDAVVVATADWLGSQLISCDNDFAGVKNAVVVR